MFHEMTAFEKKSIPPEAFHILTSGSTVEFIGQTIQKPNRAETMSAKSEMKLSEKSFADEFNGSAEIQREFGKDGVNSYIAFRKAEAAGRIKIFSRQGTNDQ